MMNVLFKTGVKITLILRFNPLYFMLYNTKKTGPSDPVFYSFNVGDNAFQRTT